MLTLFAHEGHAHTETVIKATQPQLYEIVAINALPFAFLVLLILTLRKLGMRNTVQIVIGLVYLLLVGLLGYQLMPVASIISIVAGFGLCLVLLVVPHKIKH